MTDEENEKAIREAYGVDTKTARRIIVEVNSLNMTLNAITDGKTLVAVMSSLLTAATTHALVATKHDEIAARDMVFRGLDQIFKRLTQCSSTQDQTD